MRERGPHLSLVLLAAVGLLMSDGTAGPDRATPRAAAARDVRPVIRPIALDAPLNERGVYPPPIPLAGFDGAHRLATLFKSAVTAGNKVTLWESEPGALQAFDYPLDEFVYVLEGHLVTTDADGTRREFHPGDAFVMPKGWAGIWDMKTHFKKLLVNF